MELRKCITKRGCIAKLLALLLGIVLLIPAALYPPKKHVYREEQSQATQWGVIAWITFITMIAEFTCRFFIFIEECARLISQHVSELEQQSFTSCLKSLVKSRVKLNTCDWWCNKLLPRLCFCLPLFLSALIFLIYYFTVPDVFREIHSQWSTYLGIGAVYLIMTSVTKMLENLIEPKSLIAVGSGLAYSYYYGFLKIILPEMPTNADPMPTNVNSLSIEERAIIFEKDKQIKLFSRKLFILVPDSCYCESSFEDMWPGMIEMCGKLADVVVPRAGMKDRLYSATVYRIPLENEESLHVIIDMPSILFTLYQMNMSGEQHANLPAIEKHRQVNKFCKVLKNLLDKDDSCKDRYEIIQYNDKSVTNPADLIRRGQHQQESERDLLLQIR